MKAMIFHSIFSVKSLTFVPFRPITKYYWHFVISYHDKWSSSFCYRTISPLDNINKNFTIVKQKVIFSNSADTYLEECTKDIQKSVGHIVLEQKFWSRIRGFITA